jgi:TM2 domain-containing membrane protein YozV
MAMILIPVFLAVLLGPGVGQLYNKEFKKGFILIGVSLGLLLAFSIWLSKAAIGYLPQDIETIDHALIRKIVQEHVVKNHTATFYTYQALLGGLWVYGIVDAYLGGVRRRKKLTEPVDPDSPES